MQVTVITYIFIYHCDIEVAGFNISYRISTKDVKGRFAISSLLLNIPSPQVALVRVRPSLCALGLNGSKKLQKRDEDSFEVPLAP